MNGIMDGSESGAPHRFSNPPACHLSFEFGALGPQGDSIHRNAGGCDVDSRHVLLEEDDADGNALGRTRGMPDHRTRKGRRYELASILMLSLAAMLSGANDLPAIFRRGRRLTPKGLQMLGIERRRAPCHSTFHYVFQSISAEDLERAASGS